MRPLLTALASSEHVLTYFMIWRQRRITNDVHVPNLVCLQQFCFKCENISDIEQDRIQSGNRKHSFWEDPVGDILTYLCESRHCIEKIIVIAHNAKAIDLHYILNRAIFLKWQVELIMNGMKILCIREEHLGFVDSVSLLPFALR